MKNKRIHRKYKDRVFRIIFRDKKELPELYNVVNDSAYTNPDELTITTIEDVVYKGMKKLIKSDAACLTVSGFVGSMVNTLLVMNMIYLFFGESWAAVKGIAADVIYATILGIIATNGIPEAIVAALITAAVGKVLLAMERK